MKIWGRTKKKSFVRIEGIVRDSINGIVETGQQIPDIIKRPVYFKERAVRDESFVRS